MPFVYMLRCSDGSYYTGMTKKEWLEERIGEHDAGTFDGYTAARRPLQLVWAEQFERITDAIAIERQIKGWSRAKKEALIERDWNRLILLSKRRGGGESL